VVNTNFYAVKCQLFSASSVPGTYALGVRRTSDQTESGVTCSGSCDQGKITEVFERKSGLIKTHFCKKKATHLFFYSAFLERNRFLLFFKKEPQKNSSELFLLHHAISSYPELHNNNLVYL